MLKDKAEMTLDGHVVYLVDGDVLERLAFDGLMCVVELC